MKEQLFEILKVRRDVVYGDIPGLIADIEHLVNQEVEKRIADRQLTDEQIRIEFPIGGTFKMKYNQEYAEQIKENQAKRLGAYWYRSRLTKPNNNPK